MNIFYLAWGSLIWNPRNLDFVEPWIAGGPSLPIEFSRVSQDGRLTLVVFENGVNIKTYYAQSKKKSIKDAVEDLRKRECTKSEHIAYVDTVTGNKSKQPLKVHIEAIESVHDWCFKNCCDCCVWTSLPSNFKEKLGSDFSPENAISYLDSLKKSDLEKAIEYIRKAPIEIDTPVRRLVDDRWPNT